MGLKEPFPSAAQPAAAPAAYTAAGPILPPVLRGEWLASPVYAGGELGSGSPGFNRH